ncbi:MAG: NPCBM/NEW2 domain-containing protein, partial [Lentisphaeria bacterium]|nr:NPCBM/NEW2 domain-containing protein [Lentisphaeria bacterium]
MKKFVLSCLLTLVSPLLVTANQTAVSWSKQMVQLQQKYATLGETVVISSIKKGGQLPETLKVDVRDFKELYLTAKGVPDYNFCHSIWGEGVLTTVTGEKVNLVDLKATQQKTGWSTVRKNKGVDNKPLNIGGVKLKNGFLAHGDSLIVFSLDHKFKSFEVKVGIGHTAGKAGAAQFTISSKSQNKLETEISKINKTFPMLSGLTNRLGNLWFLDKTTAKIIQRQLWVTFGQPLPSEVNKNELEKLAEFELLKSRFKLAKQELKYISKEALLRALNDLSRRYRSVYKDAKALKKQFSSVNISDLTARLSKFDQKSLNTAEQLIKSQREMLLRNPALDFDQILFIKRDRKYLGLVANFTGNPGLRQLGNRDEIMTLDYKNTGKIETVFKPKRGELITDLELDYSAEKILFSMPSKHGSWQLFEKDLTSGA